MLGFKRVVAAVAFSLALSVPALAQQSVPEISPKAAYERAMQKQALLIDTRTEREKENDGRPAAVAAEITYVFNGSEDERFVADVLKTVDGNKDAEVDLICNAGVRSARALNALVAAGFTKVRSVASGFTAWKAENLPQQAAK